MKPKYILAGFLLIVLAACNKPVTGKNGVTYKSPAQYNDYIVNRQTELMRKVSDFGVALGTDIDSARTMLDGFTRQTGTMIDEIKGMPAYKGDSSLREAAIRSFSFYKRVFEEDYMDIINIRKKEEMTQDDASEIQRIITKITREEEGLDKAFHNAQNAFAKKNNMKLRENELNRNN